MNLLKARETGIVAVLVVEILLFAVVARSRSGSSDWLFLQRDNLLGIGVEAAVIGIATIGMALVIISGGIDLSVGGVIALATVVMARLLIAGHPLSLAILLALGAGLGAGLLNALLVVVVELPPFIATLALMLIARGTAFLISQNEHLSIPDTVPVSAAFVGKFGNGAVWGLPCPLVVLVAVSLLGALVLAHSVWGRQVFAVGGNETAARLAGVRVAGVKFSVYVISAVLAAGAGILYSARYGEGQSSVASGYELDAVAGAVVGGASLSGGRGSIVGATLGALIFAGLRKGLSFVSGAADYEGVIVGTVVIGAVVLDRLIQRQVTRS